MAISSDTLLERLHLKRQLTIWRLLTIGAIIFFLVILIERKENISPVTGDFIARVNIEGVIVDDHNLMKLLKKVEENDSARALIVSLDTPGGTAVGGEALYQRLKDISEKKPVVAVMRTMCTSAGYMAAMGADRVFAMDSTLTGSIGVIMQTAEITRLAEKLGINPITVKSGTNKAAPSFAEKFTPEQRKIIQAVIDDFYEVFLGIVADSRDMDIEEVRKISNGGRVFTGRQAHQAKLVDEIGGFDEAMTWLKEKKEIDENLDIREMKVKRDYDNVFEKLSEMVGIPSLNKSGLHLDGLLLIWQPSAL